MSNKVKMDPEKAPAPVKKLIEAAKDDLMERRCIEQYIEESSVGTFDGPVGPMESSVGTFDGPVGPMESSVGTFVGPKEITYSHGETQSGSWVAIPE